jgi:hypothetical protein
MHTGQNSIVPESSLPQLGQVRWGSVIMALAALQSHPEPKATPRSTKWCEIGQQGFWHTIVPLHEQLLVLLQREIALRNKIPAARVLRRLVLIPTFSYGAVETPCTGDFQRRRKPCG